MHRRGRRAENPDQNSAHRRRHQGDPRIAPVAPSMIPSDNRRSSLAENISRDQSGSRKSSAVDNLCMSESDHRPTPSSSTLGNDAQQLINEVENHGSEIEQLRREKETLALKLERLEQAYNRIDTIDATVAGLQNSQRDTVSFDDKFSKVTETNKRVGSVETIVESLRRDLDNRLQIHDSDLDAFEKGLKQLQDNAISQSKRVDVLQGEIPSLFKVYFDRFEERIAAIESRFDSVTLASKHKTEFKEIVDHMKILSDDNTALRHLLNAESEKWAQEATHITAQLEAKADAEAMSQVNHQLATKANAEDVTNIVATSMARLNAENFKELTRHLMAKADAEDVTAVRNQLSMKASIREIQQIQGHLTARAGDLAQIGANLSTKASIEELRQLQNRVLEKANTADVNKRVDACMLAFQGLQDRYDNISTDELHRRMASWFMQTYPSNDNMVQQLTMLKQDISRLEAVNNEVSWIQTHKQNLEAILDNVQHVQALTASANALQQLPRAMARIDEVENHAQAALSRIRDAEDKTDEQTRSSQIARAAANALQTSINQSDMNIMRSEHTELCSAMHDAVNGVEQRITAELSKERATRDESLKELMAKISNNHSAASAELCSATQTAVEDVEHRMLAKLSKERTARQDDISNLERTHSMNLEQQKSAQVKINQKFQSLEEQGQQVQQIAARLQHDVDSLTSEIIEPNAKFFSYLGSLYTAVAQLQQIIEDLKRNQGPVDWVVNFSNSAAPKLTTDIEPSSNGQSRNGVARPNSHTRTPEDTDLFGWR